MGVFCEAINRPSEAYRRHEGNLSWLLVIASVLLATVFGQVINYYVNAGNFDVSIDVFKMVWLSGAGIATYLAACIILWAVGRAFGSRTKLSVYIRTWGISYIPTAICVLAVSLSETYFYVFWNNSIWAVVLGVVFITLLIWKIILYMIFLREVAGLGGKRLAGAFILCGIAILALAYADVRIGLISPIV